MITIIKRNGRTEPLDIDKIQKYTTSAINNILDKKFELTNNSIWKILSKFLCSNRIDRKYMTSCIPISNELFHTLPILKNSQKIAKFENKLAPPFSNR